MTLKTGRSVMKHMPLSLLIILVLSCIGTGTAVSPTTGAPRPPVAEAHTHRTPAFSSANTPSTCCRLAVFGLIHTVATVEFFAAR
jgi:hypothetical protein